MNCKSCNAEVVENSIKCSSCGIFLMTKKEYLEFYRNQNADKPIPYEKYHRLWVCALVGFFVALAFQAIFVGGITDSMGLTDYAEVKRINIIIADIERSYGRSFPESKLAEQYRDVPSTHNLVRAITMILLIIPSVLGTLMYDKKNFLVRKMKYDIDGTKEWKAMNKGK